MGKTPSKESKVGIIVHNLGISNDAIANIDTSIACLFRRHTADHSCRMTVQGFDSSGISDRQTLFFLYTKVVQAAGCVLAASSLLFLRSWKQVVLWSSSMRTSELAKLRWEDQDALASTGTTIAAFSQPRDHRELERAQRAQDLNGAVSSTDIFDYMAESSDAAATRSPPERRQRTK